MASLRRVIGDISYARLAKSKRSDTERDPSPSSDIVWGTSRAEGEIVVVVFDAPCCESH